MAFGMMQETKKKEPTKPKPQQPDMVKKLQDAAMAQRERDLKAEEEKKKKGKVDTAPSGGVLSRLYEMFMGSSEKK